MSQNRTAIFGKPQIAGATPALAMKIWNEELEAQDVEILRFL
jgi:hypothetical protein